LVFAAEASARFGGHFAVSVRPQSLFSRSESIAPRLAARLVALTSLLLAGVGVVTFWSLYSQRHHQLAQSTTNAADQLSAAMSLPLWNFQERVVDRILDGAMADENIAGIIVRQPNVAAEGGTSSFARSRDAQWHSIKAAHLLQEGEISEARNISYDNNAIGTLQVISSARWIDATLYSGLYLFIALILLLNAVLVTCLYVLLRREIINPLQVIGEFAHRVAETDADLARAPQGTFHGELDGLRSSIETMVRLLQGRYAALKASEARFRTLIEGAPTAIATSREGITLYCNRKFVEVYGYTSGDELVGQPVTSFWAPESRDVARERMQRRERGEAVPPNAQGIAQRKDGSHFPVEMVVASVELADGPAGVAFVTDVTERNEAQAKARKHELELVHARLGERVNLAHDLHDGLGGMLIGNIAAVEQSTGDIPSHEVLSMFRELRDDLRLIIDTASAQHYGEHSLAELLAPLRHRVTRLLETHDIDVSWRLENLEDLYLATSKSLDLMRILQESLANILKHSRATRVQVDLRRDDRSLLLEVTDNGIGMRATSAQISGVGMRSMNTRAQRLKGTLVVGSQPGATVLRLEVPL
jgi:PAS domain S-box-containing protein